MLTVVDEFRRRCLAILVGEKRGREAVVECRSDVFVRRGTPEYIRSDNGSVFTNETVRGWLVQHGVTPTFIEPGNPWGNGYNESLNGTLHRGMLSREVFDTLAEAKVLNERWRREYHEVRPHSSLEYRPPAPESIVAFDAWVGSRELCQAYSKVEACQLNEHYGWTEE